MEYIKTYFKGAKYLYRLTSASSIKMFWYFTANMNDDNQVLFTKDFKEKIMKDLDLSESAVNKALRALKENNCVFGRAPILTVNKEILEPGPEND